MSKKRKRGDKKRESKKLSTKKLDTKKAKQLKRFTKSKKKLKSLIKKILHKEKSMAKKETKNSKKSTHSAATDFSHFPSCSLPAHYFSYALSRLNADTTSSSQSAVPIVCTRNLLSVETWDGRTVVSYEASV